MSKTTAKPKKKKKFNANGVTKTWLESMGYIADIVEYRIPKTFISRDLFGCIDILAMRPLDCTIHGIQATANSSKNGKTISSNGLARHRKLLASEKAKLFVQCGGKLSLVVWSETDGVWTPSVSVITLEDFE